MQTIGTQPTGQLKRFNIRISHGDTVATQTAITHTQNQAWIAAFDLAESLLGDTPPRFISVKPVPFGLALIESRALN
jgi:hypothetical protein